jgi:hypothetical protein
MTDKQNTSIHELLLLAEIRSYPRWQIIPPSYTLMGSEVNKSECHVKIGVKYRGETILKTGYSTFFLLCFQCALLLTVVGLVCIVVLYCVYYSLRYF